MVSFGIVERKKKDPKIEKKKMQKFLQKIKFKIWMVSGNGVLLVKIQTKSLLSL